MDKVVCIIQARSASTRLPEKCFLPFNKTSIVRQIYDECYCSKHVNGKVYVATPFDDNKIIRHLALYKINLFTGSETDVLDRYYQCAKLLQADHIVRITADCPLVTSEIIDRVVNAHLLANADYTANRLSDPMYPDGFDVEVFKMYCLDLAWNMAESPEDREHVTPWIKRNAEKILSVPCSPELLPFKDIKLSVDTREDYERVLKWREENNWK
jgi:spore coat polysaccharide biosynthesis protein SpsF (cytidylyltransferase family)